VLKFIVVTDPKVRQQLAEAGNAWTAQAPVIIAACADPTRPGTKHDQPYYLLDIGIAMEHLILAATERGLGTCWIGAFDEQKAREVLGVPANIRVVATTPLGFPAESPEARLRKSLSEIVCYNRYSLKQNYIRFCCTIILSLVACMGAAAKERNQVIIALDGEGQPLAKWRLESAYPSDLLLNPIYTKAEIAEGQLTWRELAADRFAINVRLEIVDFGDLWLGADSEGKGYAASSRPLNLLYEVARSRLAQVHQIQRSAASIGGKLEQSTLEHISKAEAWLNAAQALAASPPDCARLAYRSLQESAPAGEMAVLEQARYQIKRRGYRPEFKFGANAFLLEPWTRISATLQGIIKLWYRTLLLEWHGAEAG